MKHTLINKDVLEALKEIPDESVDCITTSPPYYSLRSYRGADTIWGGSSNCEHDFMDSIITKRPNASGGHNSKKLQIKNYENFQEFVWHCRDVQNVSRVCTVRIIMIPIFGIKPVVIEIPT